MSSYAPGAVFYGEFTTCSSTGAAANADSLPTAIANHNGTDDTGFVLTVANIDTGRYRVSGTVPTGYAQGDRFAISVSAAIGGVATKSVIQCCDVRVAPLTDGAGVVTANITQLLASVLTESTPGSLAAAFKKLLDVSSPTFTVASALQSGDSFARIGNAGSALTAIGDTRLALLDAAVSSRSTYAGADTPGTTTHWPPRRRRRRRAAHLCRYLPVRWSHPCRPERRQYRASAPLYLIRHRFGWEPEHADQQPLGMRRLR